MSANDAATLLQHGAWPFVAIVAIIILGPLGYLEKSATAIGDAARNLIASIKDAKINLEQISEMASKFQSSSAEMKDTIDGLRRDIGDLTADIKDLASEYNERNRLEMLESKEAVEAAETGKGEASKPLVDNAVSASDTEPHNDLTPSQMLDKIQLEWKKVTEALSDRAGDLYDGRAIAETAYALADKRRKSSITSEEAKLLASMHSQFKSYTRRRTTVDEWMTTAHYMNFIDAAKIAQSFLGAAR